MRKQIYVARREMRLNQKDVAEVLKIHPSSYRLKENGIRDFTSTEAFSLKELFGQSLDSLFLEGGDEN